MGTPRVSASLDQMRRIQVAAKGGGECARTGTAAHAMGANAKGAGKPRDAVEASASTCCLATPPAASGCEIGPVLFADTAQQVMFAQQLLLQASWLGAFERMQEAAGSLNGVINIASTTAKRMAADFRIA